MKVIVHLKIFTVTVLYLFQFFNTPLYAQTDTLYYQDSIRVTAPEYIGGELTGRLLNIENDTLQLLYSTKTIKLPLNKITSMEFVSGETTNTWKGALYGGLAGGILTGLLAAINNSEEEGGIISFTPGEAFALGFLPGGLIGSLMGMVIGSGITSPGWVEVQPHNVIFIPQPRYHSAFTGTSFKHPDRTKKKKFTNGKIIRHDSSEVKVHPELEKTKPVGLKRKSVTYKQSEKSRNNWHLAVSFGTNSSGPAYNIEKAIIDNGWDDPKPIYGLFHIEGYEQRPESQTGFGEIGIPWSLELTYRLSNFFDVGLLTSNNPIGLTKGYRSETKKELYIEYSSWIFSAFLQFKLPGNIQLGLGPVLCSNKVHESVLSNSIKTQLGALFLFRFIYPANTPLYVKFDFQYRLVPTTSFGPINLSGGSEIALPKFDADFSHTFVGLGIGVSF